jgi:hypothetical protein
LRIDDANQLEFEWKQKGLFVTADRFKPGKISKVKLPFTPEQWVDLLNCEGDLLPSCCADISGVRDILIASMRYGGELDANELRRISFLLRNHHDKWEDGHPCAQIIAIHKRLGKMLERQTRWAVVARDLTDPKECLDMLGSCSRYFFYSIFDEGAQRPPLRDKYRDEKTFREALVRHERMAMIHYVKQGLLFAKLAPIIRTLADKLPTLFSDFKGYAIANKSGFIPELMGTPAIYQKKSNARAAWNLFLQEVKNGEDVLKNYEIRPIRITLEDGIIFTDNNGAGKILENRILDGLVLRKTKE